MLSHPNGWRRDTAQRLLVERAEKGVIPALQRALLSGDPRTRLHALWTLDGLDGVDPVHLTVGLKDRSPDVRGAAIRVSERWLAGPVSPQQSGVRLAVSKLTDDPAWEVRYQLAASIGAMEAKPRESAALAMLQKHAADPIIVDALLSGFRGSELPLLRAFVRSAAFVAGEATDAAITTITATVTRSGQDAPIQELFTWAADGSRPERERAALVRGMAVALTGAALPGARSERVAAPAATGLPCPTCPGGRAGPGGAYAYSTPEDFVIASGRAAGRGGGRLLRLSRKPETPAAGDSLVPRVEGLLARVTWPDKPGETPVAALTSAEHAQFAAGREVYANVCQACHQPDGRGQDRVAASLIDSPLALAPSEIPIRILLNGKEGTTGLMPPIGATLSDEQIANVLTYIRRDWGHTATPVSSADVKKVRELTAGRTRAWTHEELTKMIK
jgi:mono/diheme cytochrome c family protein